MRTLWAVNAEAALLLGGPRALLLQITHPAVARAVATHSRFRRDPLGRLLGTLRPMYTILFGAPAQAEQALAHLRRVHEAVRGPGYDATDPELVWWVHATLVDTAVRTYELLLRPLDPAERMALHHDAARLAARLGARRSPSHLDALQREVLHGAETLPVTSTAVALARDILDPPLWWWTPPLATVVRAVTAALLPPRLRRIYGLGDHVPRSAVALAAVSRRVLPRLPAPLRRAHLPLVLRAVHG